MKQLKLFATTSLVAFSLASFETTFAGDSIEDESTLSTSTISSNNSNNNSDTSSIDSQGQRHKKKKKVRSSEEKYKDARKLLGKNKLLYDNLNIKYKNLLEENKKLLNKSTSQPQNTEYNNLKENQATLLEENKKLKTTKAPSPQNTEIDEDADNAFVLAKPTYKTIMMTTVSGLLGVVSTIVLQKPVLSVVGRLFRRNQQAELACIRMNSQWQS